MSKTEIKNRGHVDTLVRTFYGKIRKHEVLGPIFESNVTDWEAHFELLVDFWETQLFLKRKYYGNPITAHQAVDQKMKYGITPEHFGLWLNLWFATIDELFEGEKYRTRKGMARSGDR